MQGDQKTKGKEVQMFGSKKIGYCDHFLRCTQRMNFLSFMNLNVSLEGMIPWIRAAPYLLFQWKSTLRVTNCHTVTTDKESTSILKNP